MTVRIMLDVAIFAQASDETDSSVVPIVAFFVVMAIVITAIAFARRRGRQARAIAADEELSGQDEALRRREFEDKMRRVEERLRSQSEHGSTAAEPEGIDPAGPEGITPEDVNAQGITDDTRGDEARPS